MIEGNSLSCHIPVVVGILLDAQKRFLVSQRRRNQLQAGKWEFPGGKIEAGESPLQALAREFREELGLIVEDAGRLFSLRHRYPDISVELQFWHVQSYCGTPTPIEGQELLFCHWHELQKLDLLEANTTLLSRIRNLSIES